MPEWLVKCPYPKYARIKERTDGLIEETIMQRKDFPQYYYDSLYYWNY